jgi:hypothetical protein
VLEVLIRIARMELISADGLQRKIERGGCRARPIRLPAEKRPQHEAKALVANLELDAYFDLSGTHAVLSRSYLKPGADFKASFVVSIIR